MSGRSSKVWLREVLPPSWAVVLSGVLVLVVELATGALAIGYQTAPGVADELHRPARICLWSVLAAYGCYRALAKHPIFQSAYVAFLKTTPWSSGKPLPLGPVQLVPQDLVVVALPLLLLAWHAPEQSPAGLLRGVSEGAWALLGPYLLIHALVQRALGLWPSAYVVALLVVVSLALYPVAWFAAPLVVAWLVCWRGIRRTLAAFPWPALEGLSALEFQGTRRRMEFGWPLSTLGPQAEPSRLMLPDRILAPLLVGSVFWAFASVQAAWSGRGGRPPSEPIVDLAMAWIPFLFVFRAFAVLPTHLPPTNLAGRWATGRWIIPGFDRIWLAPILASLATVAARDVCRAIGLIGFEGVALTAALAGLVYVNLAPDLTTWRLTGEYRLILFNEQRRKRDERDSGAAGRPTSSR